MQKSKMYIRGHAGASVWAVYPPPCTVTVSPAEPSASPSAGSPWVCGSGSAGLICIAALVYNFTKTRRENMQDGYGALDA